MKQTKKKKFNKCVFYDCGHGDLHPKTKKYTTSELLGKKHDHGDEGTFHEDGIFYEGVKNRDYGFRVIELLREAGATVIEVSHPWDDNSLKSRVDLANEYHRNIMPGIYFSEHSDAFNTKARGFSVWTSLGNTASDKLAEEFYNRYTKEFETIDSVSRVHAREDVSDGDHDYEANFYVLKHTIMPAILMENLFFDNILDAKILMTEEYKEAYCKLQAEWILWCLEQ